LYSAVSCNLLGLWGNPRRLGVCEAGKKRALRSQRVAWLRGGISGQELVGAALSDGGSNQLLSGNLRHDSGGGPWANPIWIAGGERLDWPAGVKTQKNVVSVTFVNPIWVKRGLGDA